MKSPLINVSPPSALAAYPQEIFVQQAIPDQAETFPGLLRVLRRRWRTMAVIATATLLLGGAVCLLITPKYSAVTTIEISRNESNSLSNSQSEDSDAAIASLKTEVQTDLNVLQADRLALDVITDVHLAAKPPFSTALTSAEKDAGLNSPMARERLAKVFRKSLTLDSPQDTRLINIKFDSPDPAVAATVANALADKFIEDTLERRYKSTSQASYWLEKELKNLKQRVQESEQRLADFQRRTGLAGIQISPSSSGDGVNGLTVNSHNTVLDRLSALNQELTAAESARISAEGVYNLVKTQNPEVVLGLETMSIAGANGSAGGALISDSGMNLLRSLRAEEANLKLEYSSYATKYGEKNPRLLQINDQLATVGTEMQTELQRITKRAENDYLYAQHSEDAVRDRFKAQQSAATMLADDTVQLQVLAQEAYSNRTLYENLFSKLQEASLAAGVRAPRIDVVNLARVPGTPSSPNYPRALAVILGAAMFFGISSAFVQEGLDDSVRTPRDLETLSQLATLAYIPRSSRRRGSLADSSNNPLLKNPASPFSEAFRSLRTSILLSPESKKIKTLLVTSPSPGDGKTTVTVNLGAAFAQQGSRVLVIDADLRNSDLHTQFGGPSGPGLSETLLDEEHDTMRGLVQHRFLPTLFMLPAGAKPKLPVELFGSPRFEATLNRLSENFNYVLIDSPPLLPVADASIIASKVDGVIAVLRSGATTRSMVASVGEVLARTGKHPLLCFILNDVSEPALYGVQAYGYASTGKDVAVAG